MILANKQSFGPSFVLVQISLREPVPPRNVILETFIINEPCQGNILISVPKGWEKLAVYFSA